MELQSLCVGCMEEKGQIDKCPNCGFSETSTPESPYYLTPRTILQDKYLVGRVLGQGGFAITYLAWDINLSIKLAIKEYFPLDLVYRIPGNNFVMAHTKAQDAIFIHDMDKFLKEARALARFMEHPNIVSVTDFFQANRTAYLVMHYIEGVTLRTQLSQVGEMMPFDLTMEIMMPVMDALRVIHDAGLLHRDISPENIIISKKGRVMLIDFGAARSSSDGKNDSISVIMKPGYTPEEQYRTKGTQGPATDIYAVAATIYRSITGQMPPNSLDRLQNDNLVPPSQLGIIIDPAVEKALLKALSVSASNRFQSVISFQEALLRRKIKTEEQKLKVCSTGPERQKTDQIALDKGENTPDQNIRPEPKVDREYTSLRDIKIGRAPDNEIILEDETASRYHAMIFSRYGKWYIADLDSTHGTYVNDQHITEPVEMVVPSSIRLSESTLNYDGNNITGTNGEILYSIADHLTFSERWYYSNKLSVIRFIDNFLTTFDRFTLRPDEADSMITVSIGRASDNDIVINDDMVSRYHLQLFSHAGRWFLADLKSTHGTRVNDLPVEEPLKLNSSDRITLSDIEIYFEGNSIFNEDGENLYNLPTLRAISFDNSNNVAMTINHLIDEVFGNNLWIVGIAVIVLVTIIIVVAAAIS